MIVPKNRIAYISNISILLFPSFFLTLIDLLVFYFQQNEPMRSINQPGELLHSNVVSKCSVSIEALLGRNTRK